MIRNHLVAIALCALAAAAPAGELVVARSNDPAHAAGTIVDGSATFQVAEGKSVTLIAQDGRKLRLDGPYRGAPDARPGPAGESMLATLSRLLTGRNSLTMAVFRGAPRSATATVIALDSGAVRCAATTEVIRFSRRGPIRPATFTLEQSGGDSVHGPWPPDAGEIAWPEALPVRSDANYTATLSDDRGLTEIRLFTVPRDLPSDAHAVAWMAERGCKRDARRALGRLVR